MSLPLRVLRSCVPASTRSHGRGACGVWDVDGSYMSRCLTRRLVGPRQRLVIESQLSLMTCASTCSARPAGDKTGSSSISLRRARSRRRDRDRPTRPAYRQRRMGNGFWRSRRRTPCACWSSIVWRAGAKGLDHAPDATAGSRSLTLDQGQPRRSQACADDAARGEASSRSMATSSACTGDVRSLNASIGLASVSRLRRVSRRMR